MFDKYGKQLMDMVIQYELGRIFVGGGFLKRDGIWYGEPLLIEDIDGLVYLGKELVLALDQPGVQAVEVWKI